MPMRKDFCAFVLTHGRSDRVYTCNSLKRCGYTGPVYIIIDNEDKTADKYRKNFGDKVIVFDKKAVADTIDEGDNFGDRRAIIYARNACFDIAERLGYEYFIQLDDDYKGFVYKFDDSGRYVERPIKNLNMIWNAMVKYFESIDAKSIAMAQCGDFIGATKSAVMLGARRKAMNSFICSTRRRFEFTGRVNEDVNTYICSGSRGNVFMTIPNVALHQATTQGNSGGMTEMYLDAGTYVKSFYTVMYSPSSVRIGGIGTAHRRIHHRISWRHAVPQIISENYRRM